MGTVMRTYRHGRTKLLPYVVLASCLIFSGFVALLASSGQPDRGAALPVFRYLHRRGAAATPSLSIIERAAYLLRSGRFWTMAELRARQRRAGWTGFYLVDVDCDGDSDVLAFAPSNQAFIWVNIGGDRYLPAHRNPPCFERSRADGPLLTVDSTPNVWVRRLEFLYPASPAPLCAERDSLFSPTAAFASFASRAPPLLPGRCV
jgi:hypothetical protein